jgi:hypothetical protein
MNGFRFSLIAASVALASLAADAKTLRYSFQGDINSLDPYALNETFTHSFLSNVYEGLTMRDKALNAIPGLATEWTNVEPTIWRFKLRQGVKFQDGAPFTADDVIFSYQRVIKEGSDDASLVASVKEVKKLDDFTVDFVTGTPNPILPKEITSWMIFSKSWAEKNGANEPSSVAKKTENFATRNANGTGPFMVKSRESGVRTVLVVNPNWWGKREHDIDEVVFTPITSDATRVAALLSGELDLMHPVPLQDVERLRGEKAIEILQGPELRTIFLGLDQSRDELIYSNVKGKNPFKDVRVRKAVYQAIDTEAIKSRIMRGASRPSGLGRARRQRLRCGDRSALSLRCRGGEEAARRGRLSRRLRGAARLPERSLRQRRAHLPGGRGDAGARQHQGEPSRADQVEVLPKGALEGHVLLYSRLAAAELRRALDAVQRHEHARRQGPDRAEGPGRLQSRRLQQSESRPTDASHPAGDRSGEAAGDDRRGVPPAQSRYRRDPAAPAGGDLGHPPGRHGRAARRRLCRLPADSA